MGDRFVEVGGLRVRYRCVGARGPVLLHGIERRLEDWSLNMLALGGSSRVFAVGFPGCGFLDRPDLSYSIPFLAGLWSDDSGSGEA